MFFDYPRYPKLDKNGSEVLKDKYLERNNNIEYSKELINIIYKMMENDPNKRPNSGYILKKLKKYIIHEEFIAQVYIQFIELFLVLI